MIGEVGAAAVKVSIEAAKETAKEVGKAAAEKSVDIGKRIDVGKKAAEISGSKIDISKRVAPEAAKEIAGKDINRVAKEYINDLKGKSEFANTIKPLDTAKLEIQSPEKVRQLRDEFNKNRSQIRKDWETLNHKEWPRYTEDVYRNGVKVKQAGDYYDAHHVQSLKLGGTNDARNITPLDYNSHKDIHSVTGSCTRLVEKVGGIAKV